MVALERLDISRNQFSELPTILVQLPSLSNVIVRENTIGVVDAEKVREMKQLKELDLRGNPLPASASQLLAGIESIRIYVDLPADAPNDASSEASGVPCNKLDELD